MTEVVRLTLVSHAMTEAMTALRFPADEPLNQTGCREVEAAAALDIRGRDGSLRELAGPERRVLQTARLLGLSPTPEPRLADLDCGRWRGLALDEIQPGGLAEWRDDPATAPHGGESIVGLVDRVGGWLESLTQDRRRTVAVTHPAVIRAAVVVALDVSAKSFWRIDIKPVSRTVLHFRDGRWTLRL